MGIDKSQARFAVSGDDRSSQLLPYVTGSNRPEADGRGSLKSASFEPSSFTVRRKLVSSKCLGAIQRLICGFD